MTGRPCIWVTEPIHPDALALLDKAAERLGPGPIPEERMAQVDAVIVRTKRMDAAAIGTLPKLTVIGKHGAGLDNIEMAAAEMRGIGVFRAEGTNAASVADLSVLLALMLLRAPDLHDHALRRGDQAGRIGFELSERSIGILGMGAIGREVAGRLVAGFKADVAGYDPALPDNVWPQGVHRYADPLALLGQTDLLFLHLPLLRETTGMIGAKQIALLKPGAFIVNCARGGIVDEAALAAALSSGQLAGAASDVFEDEPISPDNPLLHCGGRFIATPHIGASTAAGLRRTGMTIAIKVLDALGVPHGATQ